jgi:N-acetylglucosamine-6-phosphate deacetylase
MTCAVIRLLPMNGTFDLQVNGYGGVDFNQDDLTPEQLHLACAALQRDGVDGILATIITEKLDVMAARLRRLVELRERDPLAQHIIAGLHIEGPFINETPGYRGAHPVDAIVPATIEAAAQLVEAGSGLVRLVTLAPERDENLEVTRFLHRQNVRVAAGHCDASRDELKAAIDAGLSLFTHLGNGCPMQMHRHDNIVQRALSLRDQLWLCFIADGAHVPFFALRNYIELASVERCVVVTDAIAPASLGPGLYTLGRWQLQIGEDMVARAPDGSHLVGAAITMPQSAANLECELGLDAKTVQRLTCLNPRRALGLV